MPGQSHQNTPSLRRLAAIMFTDIAGYTATMGDDEKYGLYLLQLNRTLQKPRIEKHGGKWLKEMGDGVLASFDNAYHAVKCAIDIQLSADEHLKNRIRIGIHLGNVTFEDNDVFGDGVNIASRLESIANPGGVYFSESVMNAIRSNAQFKTSFVGELRLKNVISPVKTYCLQHEEMPAPFSERIKRQLASDKIKSIAILPFANLSGNTEQQYFVDGMHDALITEISKIGSLRVISRTSTLRYRDSDKSIPQIASELDVDGLIEASVLMADEKVRVQVQLIKAFPEENHLWADSYDRKIENILDLHSSVVKDITDKIKIQLTPRERSMLAESRTVDPEAYKAYLNGKYHLEKLSADGFKSAMQNFEKSIKLDPSFAPVYAEMANHYMYALQMRMISVTEAFPKIYHYNRKALEIDPLLPEANYTMTLMSWFEWDWGACEKGFKKVLEQNPNHVLSNAVSGHLYMLKDQFDQATLYMEKALELDPRNDLVLAFYGVVCAHKGAVDRAIELGWAAYKLNPHSILTIRLLEAVSYLKGDLETSIDMLERVYSEVFPLEIEIKKEYLANGYKSTMEKLAQTLEQNSQGQDMYIAMLLNRAGLREKAILRVLKAYDNHDGDIPYFFRVKEMSHLKSDPRIAVLAEKVNLPL
jgi:adenylate cyclase